MYATALVLGVLTLANAGLVAAARSQALTSVAQNLNDQRLFPPVLSIPLHPEARQHNIDNTCGPRANGRKCDPKSPGGGPCCSGYGFCGNTELYCKEGCQREFSECNISNRVSHNTQCGPKHKNKKCADGFCCSANGKCGKSEAFCGKHCRPEFGRCDVQEQSKPTSSPTTPMSTPSLPSSGSEARHGRCGPEHDNRKCTNGDCCSAEGWCGKGSDFCRVPQSCQRGFGTCDSDAVPKGFDISTQPRPQMGAVPYGRLIDRCLKPDTIALSFDDGPSNQTSAIRKLLQEYNAKGTFFLSGNTNAKGMIDETDVWVDEIIQMVFAGHQVASHSWSHPDFHKASRDFRLTDMYRNDRAISNIIGKFPTYMRPPYLNCTDGDCLNDMADIGYHVTGYEFDTDDTNQDLTLEQLKSKFDKAMDDKNKPGANMLVIQHDHTEHVLELTKHILERARSRKWQAVTLGDCLNDPLENWYRPTAWIDLDSTSRPRCVVSSQGFCGSIAPFGSKEVCRLSSGWCYTTLGTCVTRLGDDHPSCQEYDRICAQLKDNCEQCAENGRPKCNSNEWPINRFAWA